MADDKKTAKKAASSEPTTEAEVKQFSATGGRPEGGPMLAGPTQDDLNPAFAPAKEDEDGK
jgi:hypothetical protein